MEEVIQLELRSSEENTGATYVDSGSGSFFFAGSAFLAGEIGTIGAGFSEIGRDKRSYSRSREIRSYGLFYQSSIQIFGIQTHDVFVVRDPEFIFFSDGATTILQKMSRFIIFVLSSLIELFTIEFAFGESTRYSILLCWCVHIHPR